MIRPQGESGGISNRWRRGCHEITTKRVTYQASRQVDLEIQACL